MKPDLTVPEFIAALRAKAKAINERADALENDWSAMASDLAPAPSKANGSVSQQSENHRPVSVEELKAAMSEMKGRIKNFAEHFQTSEAVIAALVNDPKNGINNKDRGWLNLTDSPE